MSGAMQVLMAGKSAPLPVVSLRDRSRFKFSVSPADAHTGYRLLASGDEYYAEGTSLAWYDTGDNWLLSGSAADYDAYVTLNSGDALTSGTVGAWVNLGTDRSWYNSVTGPSGTQDSNLTIQIAATTDHATILASCNVNLNSQTETSF